MNDYQQLIQLNPVVPYALNGFQRSHWFNYVVLVNSDSMKSFSIDIFANTPGDALFYANRLKTYIESNPLINRYGQADDISVGILSPVRDPLTYAYKVSMVMNAGMLRVMSGKESQDCGGELSKCDFGCNYWITRCDDEGPAWEFGDSFGNAFFNHDNTKSGSNKCK